MTASATSELRRRHLSLTILEVVESFPQSQRALFTRVHYGGERIEAVAQSMGIDLAAALRTLAQCEAKLRDAVRTFRPPGERACADASLAACS